MWRDYRNADKLEEMKDDVKKYKSNHNRLQTLKYISKKYFYTMQAGITFLSNI